MNKSDQVINQDNSGDEKLRYRILAPINDADNIEHYIKALDWAIEGKHEVYNVALTGPYGSGKSSVLETYKAKKKNCKEDFLSISLAAFYGSYEQDNQDSYKNHDKTDGEIIDNQSEDFGTINNFIENEIEKSILQQLFYKVDPKKIPYTRFRRIENITKPKIGVFTGLFLILTFLGAMILNPLIILKIKQNINFINKSPLFEYPNEILVIMVIAFIGLGGLGIYKLIFYLNSRFRLSRIIFPQAEFNINKDDNESIFNKYLDEILYFFEATKYKVVLIEDLDRFNNTGIFTKLRELNSLINNYEKINRKIVFVYAVKDDMFMKNERTKFFEFIIPVIPVIDSSNSKEKFLEIKKKNTVWNDISEQYINGISVYVNDMRMLNCINNEFYLYKKTLNYITNLKSQQMLSIIIYKNIYPGDFALLPLKKGILGEVFKNKKASVENVLPDMKSKIKQLEDFVITIEREKMGSIRELKAAFLASLSSNEFNITALQAKGETHYIYTILGDDFNMENLNSEDVYIINNNNNSRRTSISNADQNSGNKLGYMKRFQNIKYKSEQELDKIKNEISELKEQINLIKTLPLSKLIEKYGANIFLTDKALREPLLVFLLRKGYIDENYPNYITHFYSNSINAQDMEFVLGVRNREGKEYTYELTYFTEIITRLNEYEFSQREILNFSLLDYLLENNYEYEKQLEAIMCQLKDESSESMDFIDSFKLKGMNWDIFWKEMCNKWTNMWMYFVDDSKFSKDKIDDYLKEIVRCSNRTDIIAMNTNNNLTDYISKHENFLRLVDDVDSAIVKRVIKDLGVKFYEINCKGVSADILDYVFDNNMYVINPGMIRSIIGLKSDIDTIKLTTSNLTTVRSSGYMPLIKYIDQYINEYLEEVFLKIETNIEESVDNIVDLLNNTDITKDFKKSIIKSQEFELQNITSVGLNMDLWSEIFQSFKVKIKWENVIAYYKEDNNVIGKILINYLDNENVYNNLSNYIINESFKDEELIATFSRDLIDSNVSDSGFEELSKSIGNSYDNYEIEILSTQRVKVLIERGILKLNNYHYNKLVSNYSDNHILLLEKYASEFIREISTYNLNEYDTCLLLMSNHFNDEEKLRIIKNKEEDINLDILLIQIYNFYTSSEHLHKITDSLFMKICNIISNEDSIKLLEKQIKYISSNTLTSLFQQFQKCIILFLRSEVFTEIEKRDTVLLVGSIVSGKEYMNEIYSFIISSRTSFSIPHYYLIRIMGEIDRDNKLKLLVNQLEFIDSHEEITECLNNIGGCYADLTVRDGRHIYIGKTTDVVSLGKILEEKRYISSYSGEEDFRARFIKKRN